MRDQVRQHKDKAASYLSRGKYRAAAKQFQSALQIAPDDVAIRQKLGDVLHRMGEMQLAIREYQHVAGRYAADGFLLKAMAICKVILNLDPRHTETQEALAKLYATHHGVANDRVLPASMSGALRSHGQGHIGGGLTVKRAARPPPPPEDSGPSAAVPSAAVPSAAVPNKAVPETPASNTVARSSPASAAEPDAAPPTKAGPLPGATATRATTTRATPPPLPDDVELVEGMLLPADAIIPLAADDKTDTTDMEVDDDTSTLDEASADDDSLDLSVLLGLGDSSAPLQDVSGDVDLEMTIGPEHPDTTGTVDEEIALIDEQFAMAEATSVSMAGIPPIPLFSQLDPEAFVAVFEHLDLKTVPSGDLLIREGDRGSEMFIIVQGRVEVFRLLEGEDGRKAERTLAEMGDGAFFGEMALLADAPRMASVRTTRETAVLVIDRDTLNHIATLHPSVAEVALQFYRERLLANLLRSNPLFKPFNDEEKQALMDGFQSASIDEGVILLERGQQGDGLYLLLRGTCQVVDMTPEGKVLNYPDLKEGDVFGEISMLTGGPVTATVRTKTEALVLRLDRDTFYERMMANPEVRRQITQLTNDRLRRTAEMSSNLSMTATSLV